MDRRCEEPVDDFVRNESDKEEGSRFSMARAFSCAGHGVADAVRSQRNMKVHLAVAVAVILLGAILAFSSFEWIAVIICITLVIADECFNTALEAVVDLVSPEFHELARTAKDCAAGAVLVCALGAVVVGCTIIGTRIFTLL